VKECGEVYYNLLKLITFKRQQFRSKADLARALSTLEHTVSRQRVQQLVLKALQRGDLLDDPFPYRPQMIRHGGKSRYPKKEELQT